MKSSIFQISNSKIWRISALKVYLKLNQKEVLINLSTHGKPSLKMKKKSGQIVLYLEIFNFKTFRAEILQIFELLLWKIDDFINSFWHNLTFNLGGKCASIIVGTKLGNSGHSGLVREIVGVKKFTCLSLSIIRCSDDLLAPKRFNFMVLNEKQVPDKFKQPFPPYLLEALGIRCSSM